MFGTRKHVESSLRNKMTSDFYRVYAITVNASFVNGIPNTRGSWFQTIEINDDDQFNLRVVV